MKIKCPQCGNVFFIDESEFVEGKKKVKCPSCGKILLIKLKKKPQKETEQSPQSTSTSFDSTPPFDDVTRAEDLFGSTDDQLPGMDSFDSPLPEEEDIFGDLPPPEELPDPGEDLFSSGSDDFAGGDTEEDLFPPPGEDFLNQPEEEHDSSTAELFGEIPAFDEPEPTQSGPDLEENDFPDFDWDEEPGDRKAKQTPEPIREEPEISEERAALEKQLVEDEDIDEEEFKPLIEEEEAEQILEEAIVRESDSGQKKKPITLFTIVLILILIVVAGIFVAYKYFPEELPVRNYINSLFQPPPEPNPYHDMDRKVKVETTRTWRLFNVKGDRLIVFQGKVKNIFNKNLSYIRLRIYLLGPDKQPVLIKDFYAGNTFTREELKLISPKQIEAKLNNKFGDTFINETVPPGKEIPFMVVLINPPPYSEYRIVSLSSFIGD